MSAGLPLYQATHAVHSCFVLHEGRILCACEDIGRHNALDKAVGSTLLAGVPLSECVLYTSGRVPMDMVRKAIRAGVPALVSKTMPTVQSLELAAEYGLQFVCGRKHPLTLKERTKLTKRPLRSCSSWGGLNCCPGKPGQKKQAGDNMKQATNPFAPVPLWRKRLPGYAAMGAATVAMAIGLIAMQNARTTVAGTLLPVSEADAAAYGISAVYQLDNGSYRVEGSQKGFQSDVQAAVTLDAEGNVSAVEILSQAETDSLGGQCVNPEFTSQYQGAAPFTLTGKSYTVTDPLTGAAYAAAGAAEEQPAAGEDLDPAQWNVSDTSPEAEATRRMYAAGLTLSALNGEPLADELIPPMDTSAEAVARRKLYAAGLSKSAQDGEEQALPYADWSAEKQAAYRLAQAELTTGQTSAGAVSADLTEVDALSGATITSTAVTNIVNNSYFYVTEVLRAE